MRPETIKFLEESIGRTLSDINHSSILFNPSLRVMHMKTNDEVDETGADYTE